MLDDLILQIVLQNEIVSLKSNVESWERKCSDLEVGPHPWALTVSR